MMRKHFLNMDTKELTNNCPFYSWDCITLQIKNKGDLYLIIKNEHCMSQLLKFLIYSLETADGTRGTLVPLIKRQVKQLIRKFGGI